VNDDIPPREASNEVFPPEACLATRILQLQQEHRSLDEQIAEMYEYPYRDQLMLQRLKKKKLRIKDTIERLQNDLIPDLNA
jgi:hypothetical protein